MYVWIYSMSSHLKGTKNTRLFIFLFLIIFPLLEEWKKKSQHKKREKNFVSFVPSMFRVWIAFRQRMILSECHGWNWNVYEITKCYRKPIFVFIDMKCFLVIFLSSSSSSLSVQSIQWSDRSNKEMLKRLGAKLCDNNSSERMRKYLFLSVILGCECAKNRL